MRKESIRIFAGANRIKRLPESGRGIDFLESWIQQHVTEAKKKRSHERARELADKCIDEAAGNGISIDDMEPEWGSVEEIIYDAMQDILGDELAWRQS